MSDAVDAIIESFRREKFAADPQSKILELLSADRAIAARIAQAVMHDLGDEESSSLLLAPPLAFVPPDRFAADVVEYALNELRHNPDNEPAQYALSHAACQFPRLLHPHLPELFRLPPVAPGIFHAWPWRESDFLDVKRLGPIVADPTAAPSDRARAWKALLETRNVSALDFAAKAHPQVKEFFDHDWARDLDVRLHGVDVTREPDGRFRTIVPWRVIHLRFPKPAKRWHPTWFATAAKINAAGTAKFGGVADGTCATCGGQLHHLITLDPVTRDLLVTSVQRLTLGTCLTCLGWEVMTAFYAHDEAGAGAGAGVPRDITQTKPSKPEYRYAAFKPMTVQLVETPPRWRWQEWGFVNGENLNRLGGHPSWVQQPEVPSCPRCQQTMTFLLQLDDDLPNVEGKTHMWSSGGMAYAFWCDACRISAWTVQAT